MRHAVTPAMSWPSEREVADQLPIEADPDAARGVLDTVPSWFHTFALSSSHGIYTPGVARDHGCRLASIPDSFEGLSVLDVGAFDGFYSFLAEQRGARRVLAIDNEQYPEWVRDPAEFFDGHTFELHSTPVVDGHPRVIGAISSCAPVA